MRMRGATWGKASRVVSQPHAKLVCSLCPTKKKKKNYIYIYIYIYVYVYIIYTSKPPSG